jgi:membrane fusion protein (multidrug efflux system)
VTLFIACAFLLGACGRSGGETADAGKAPGKAAAGDDAAAGKGAGKGGDGGPPPALPVTVIPATPKRVPIVFEVPGQATGSRDVEIRARVSGILEKRTYEEGDPVKAGAVLFRIDPQPYRIALEEARAQLDQARAALEQAEREAKRLEGLAKERAISQREYDTAVSTAKSSGAAVNVARAQVRSAELNLSYTTVTAPISGITGRALRSEGSLVSAGSDAALLTTLTQVDPVWVLFSIAPEDYERIREDASRAQVRFIGQDGKELPMSGRLNFAASTVDPKLSTVQLRAQVANPDLRWLPGQFVRVRLLAGEQEGVLVPQAAVVQTEQARMVWVVDEAGKAAMKPVRTAGWVGSDWVVTGGLEANDRVIVDNLVKLRPGAPVDPRPPAATKPPAEAPQAAPRAGNAAAGGGR